LVVRGLLIGELHFPVGFRILRLFFEGFLLQAVFFTELHLFDSGFQGVLLDLPSVGLGSRVFFIVQASILGGERFYDFLLFFC
jgi:hypothetical protein